jgi:hypothetical protein
MLRNKETIVGSWFLQDREVIKVKVENWLWFSLICTNSPSKAKFYKNPLNNKSPLALAAWGL